MKKIFLMLLISVSGIAAFSQIKGAQIDIYHFTAMGNQYRLDCQISGMNTTNGQNKFMLCFMKNSSNKLQVIPINNQQFLNTSNNQLYPILLNTTFANSPVYFVLSAGSNEAINKSLLLVNNEVQQIDDILNLLNNSGIIPLTYKVYNIN